MVKNIGQVVVLALSVLFGCAQNTDKGDTEAAETSDSMMMFARAAVEVGRIEVGQMREFEASVVRMTVAARSQLWRSLEELHDRVHVAEPAERDAIACAGASAVDNVAAEGGCSNARCSHSSSCGLAQWCCAFGEDAIFYDDAVAQ